MLNISSEPLVPWLNWALREYSNGVIEIPGSKHNQRIIHYHSYTSLKATEDEVPWCASFMCAALEESGLNSPKSARARDFEKYGTACKFNLGVIAVFWRVSPTSGNGHVGIALRETDKVVTVLGGNQGDSVSIKDYSKSQLLGYRWPSGFNMKHWLGEVYNQRSMPR